MDHHLEPVRVVAWTGVLVRLEINENRRDELVLLSASRIKKKIFATASMIAAPT